MSAIYKIFFHFFLCGLLPVQILQYKQVFHNECCLVSCCELIFNIKLITENRIELLISNMKKKTFY